MHMHARLALGTPSAPTQPHDCPSSEHRLDAHALRSLQTAPAPMHHCGQHASSLRHGWGRVSGITISLAGARSGRSGAAGPAFTASAWRMLRWACDYAQLLRPMRAQAAGVLGGVAELFDMYLVHTFHVFAGVSLADLASGNASRLGTEDAVPARLKTCVLRILSHSLSGYRAFYLPNQAAQQQVGQCLGCGAAPPGW